MLEAAGIAYKVVGVDLVEIDCRFILHTPTRYWRDNRGVRRGYSVHELMMAVKTPALPNP